LPLRPQLNTPFLQTQIENRYPQEKYLLEASNFFTAGVRNSGFPLNRISFVLSIKKKI
jgi:hypothetical protein